MARIECYISDALKEKINKLADHKSIPASKYINQVLANHCAGDNKSNAVFQKKVMATLCDIYTCVFDPNIQSTNRDVVLARMQNLKRQCEAAVNGF